MKIIYQGGSLLLLGMKLQLYFLLKTLMGGIVLGVFPALFGTFRIISKCISERDISHVDLMKELKKFDKKEFVKINLIGYLFAFFIYILALNMWVSRYFLQVSFFHFVTLIALALTISVGLYTVALFTKYDLPIYQYIFQGFLCSIVGIFETIAIALGIGIATGLGLAIPLISFFLWIPLLMLPHAWFSRAVIARLERIFYKEVVK